MRASNAARPPARPSTASPAPQKLCSENNCDILLLRRSTKGKLSDDIPKYIMKSRAAVLVYQGEDGGASPTAGSSIKSLGANSSKALL